MWPPTSVGYVFFCGFYKVHIHAILINLRFTTYLHAHSLPQALASLAEAAYEAAGGDEDPETYLLSPHFGDIIKNLVETADR